MTKRKTKVVLICEDRQHSKFATQFLDDMGWRGVKVRVEMSPRGKGSGEYGARKKLLEELHAYRALKNKSHHVLIAIIDADTKTITDIHTICKNDFKKAGIDFRKANEAVAIIIPRRNIETWIHYSNGNIVNETTNYKLRTQHGCPQAAAKLAGYCKTNSLPSDAPASLAAACEEYNHRIHPNI